MGVSTLLLRRISAATLKASTYTLRASLEVRPRAFFASSSIPMSPPKCQELTKMSRDEVKTFLDSFDTVMTDCDGVLWMGNDEIAGSAKMVRQFRAMGKKVFFCTNNSTKSRQDYVQKCQDLDFGGTKDEIVGTSYLAAAYLKDMNFKGTVYVVGSKGVTDELDEVGIPSIGVGETPLVHVDKDFKVQNLSLNPDVKAVIVSYVRDFSHGHILEAFYYLQNPAHLFLGTEGDQQIPGKLPDGSFIPLPGTGSMVAAVASAAERQPVVMGKPSPMMFEIIQKHYPQLEAKRTLMIGDRANTDILLGKNCGLQTLMVGTGCHTLANIREWESSEDAEKQRLAADYYIDRLGDIASLLE